MFRTTKIHVLLAAIAAAASIALSASAADASIRLVPTTRVLAATPSVSIGAMSEHLSVAKNGSSYYTVQVSGVVSMTQAGAQQLLASGYRVKWDLYGSDPIFDDYLFGPDPASVTATSQGLAFTGVRVTTSSLLNEDDSWFDDHDELISHAKLVDSSGTTVKSAQSNEVGGYF